MKKVIYWSLAIHLIVGGFFPSLVAGVSYKEFDAIKQKIEQAQASMQKIDKITRLFVPWI